MLGQTDFMGLDHNRAPYYPTAGAMNMPYGLTVQGERLVVADTANSRLLGFDLDELAMGVAAIALAGQRDVHGQGRQPLGAADARQPLLALWRSPLAATTLAIADSGNNRVLLWEAAP